MDQTAQVCGCCGDDWAVTSYRGDPMCADCAAQLRAYDRHAQPCQRLDSHTLADFARRAGREPGRRDPLGAGAVL